VFEMRSPWCVADGAGDDDLHPWDCCFCGAKRKKVLVWWGFFLDGLIPGENWLFDLSLRSLQIKNAKGLFLAVGVLHSNL